MSTAPGTAPRPTAGTSGSPRSSSRWGRLLPVAIVVLGLLELTILVLIGINTSLWWSVLIIVVGWVIGVALVVAAGQQSFVRLRSLVRAVRGRGDIQDHLSRPAFTMLSALCFFFPGILTDLIGLILLVTPVQRKSVAAMGLGGGSAGARKVLYRRSGEGVIDGEIILNAQKPPRSGDDSTPPTISQG
ncbi:MULTISPECIES: FxsA family protein [unclassified Brachybacterium]|uniref:FxsA family protein n=1 Tax=unclassified Brachybacterium TaxID=2623841 RepID=UPI004034EE4B